MFVGYGIRFQGDTSDSSQIVTLSKNPVIWLGMFLLFVGHQLLGYNARFIFTARLNKA